MFRKFVDNNIIRFILILSLFNIALSAVFLAASYFFSTDGEFVLNLKHLITQELIRLIVINGIAAIFIYLIFIRRIRQLNDTLVAEESHAHYKTDTLNYPELEALVKGFQSKLKEYEVNKKHLNAKVELLQKNLSSIETELLSQEEYMAQAKEQLITHEKMASLGGLVAGISHEINTPIGISVTAASYLKSHTEQIKDIAAKGKLTNASFNTYITTTYESSDILLKNLERAADVIRSFKQIAVDQSSDHKRTFNLKKYLEEVILSLKPKLKPTKISISINCAGDITLYHTPGNLSHIITNLVTNSLLHAYDENEAGIITINVTREANLLCILYEDDGKGIEKDNISHIFEPYFSTKHGRGGSGLGLHIISSIVGKMSGTIECQSELTEGTLFKMSFPMKEFEKR